MRWKRDTLSRAKTSFVSKSFIRVMFASYLLPSLYRDKEISSFLRRNFNEREREKEKRFPARANS